MYELLFIGLGGFLGSCLRQIITKYAIKWSVFIPVGTLLSNVIAGLFIGFIIGLERNSMTIPLKTKVFLTTGLLGGLSTFSTFSLETVDLFTSGEYLLAVGNIALNLGFSLIGVIIGLLFAKMLIYNTKGSL